MRKILLAYVIAMVFGIFTYLLLSGSDYRLMSLDTGIQSLHVQLEKNIVPEYLKAKEFNNEQLKLEFQSIYYGVSLGMLIWAVLFVLHRIQIFVVDFSAFFPLKK